MKTKYNELSPFLRLQYYDFHSKLLYKGNDVEPFTTEHLTKQLGVTYPENNVLSYTGLIELGLIFKNQYDSLKGNHKGIITFFIQTHLQELIHELFIYYNEQILTNFEIVYSIFIKLKALYKTLMYFMEQRKFHIDILAMKGYYVHIINDIDFLTPLRVQLNRHSHIGLKHYAISSLLFNQNHHLVLNIHK